MTGMEINAIRKSAGLTQEEFGSLSGVNKMTVCRWEKMGCKNISAYKGKEPLQTLLRFLSILVDVQRLNPTETQNVIPAPFDFGTYVDKGEPLVLSDSHPMPGDLVVVYTASDHQPVNMGIVVSVSETGVVNLQGRDGSIDQTDADTYCRLVRLAIHRPHYVV